MVSGSLTEVLTSPIAVERLWKTILDADHLLPKILSDVVSKVEILSGDGGVGTVKSFHFTDAAPFEFITEKTEEVDHENHVFKYSVVEGGLLGVCLQSTSFEFNFKRRIDGGCTGTLTMLYETLSDADLTAVDKATTFQGAVEIVKAVDAYLAANPYAYA